MNLSDYFSDFLKKDFAKRNINLGKTLLIKIPDFNISYKKYWIIVAFNQRHVGGVIINTEINKNIFWNEELRKLNIPILEKEHSFLEYDSFVDCSKINKQPFKDICKAIEENPQIVVGNVTDELLRSIHIAITNANTISIKDKKEFGFL